MAKRFTDTDKYNKVFFRGLPGAYKLLWDYLYHECNHAGIWSVDREIAEIKIGRDMTFDWSKALEIFNTDEERILVLRGGLKWFIRPFISFQYGVEIDDLNPDNRVHASVILSLRKEGACKALVRPLERAKDKDSLSLSPVLSLSLGEGEGRGAAVEVPEDLKISEPEIRDWLAYKKQRGENYKPLGLKALWRRLREIPADRRREAVDQSMGSNYAGLFWRENGRQGNSGDRPERYREHGKDYSGVVKRFNPATGELEEAYPRPAGGVRDASQVPPNDLPVGEKV